ncbi:hypothetical protein BGZ94_003521 [Podila epigama]|nr:hypothetical protein BGZ94_003521 [Podila epigama]
MSTQNLESTLQHDSPTPVGPPDNPVKTTSERAPETEQSVLPKAHNHLLGETVEMVTGTTPENDLAEQRDLQGRTPFHLPPPPAYQPRDTHSQILTGHRADASIPLYPGHHDDVSRFSVGGLTKGDLENRRVWDESPANDSDVAGQSSGEDDFSDNDDGAEDDELDEENYSDEEYDDFPDIQAMDDLSTVHPIVGDSNYLYNHPGQVGSYQHTSIMQELQTQAHIQRKRPLRSSMAQGSDLQLEIPNPYVSELATVNIATSSAERELMSQYDDITRQLHQADIIQVMETITNILEQVIQQRKEDAPQETSEHTSARRQLLESIYFGAWAKVLLERRPNLQPGLVIAYLQEFVQLACLIIQQDNDIPEIYAQTLVMMFDQGDFEISRRNAKRSSRLSHERLARFSNYQSEFGMEDDDAPQVQLEFQSLFVSLGGISLCLETIERLAQDPERNDIKLKTILLLLTILSRIQPQVREPDHSQVVTGMDTPKRLTTAILSYFPEHLDGFKSANKSIVLNIINLVGHFLLESSRAPLSPSFHQEPDIDFDFESKDSISKTNAGETRFADFRLEMAVRLMKTTRLDLRLAGLIELKEVLVRIQRLQQGRSRFRRRSDTEVDEQVEVDKIPIEHLCSRLKSLQIVGHIFGSNIHLEIVQRSTDVLVFMVQAKAFSIEDLDLIWASVGGNQHRSIVYGVYQVLNDLSSKLPQDYLKHLFAKLQAAPLEIWDQQLVDLARSMFEAMVQRAKYNPEEGPISLIPFMTLLNVLRAATPNAASRDEQANAVAASVSPDVLGNIINLLLEGIGVGPLPQDRKELVDFCIQDLKTNHPGAIWGLQVIQQIFELHFRNGENTRLQFYKQTCVSLPELFVSDLKAYASSVKRQPPAPSPTVAAFVTPASHQSSQEYFKNIQLRNRFVFLKAMSRLFPVYWSSIDLADTLWGCFIADPIGPQEKDEAFNCLEGINDFKFAEYVYQKLLPELDVTTLTERGWGCLRQYFLLINWHGSNVTVKAESPNASGQVIMVLAPMQGMDLIWKVALHTLSPSVGTQATAFLSQMIKSHAEQNDMSRSIEEVTQFREGLVKTCVEHLVASSKRLSNVDPMELNEVSLEFKRCIGILKAFLMTCSSEITDGSFRPDIHGTLDDDVMLTIKINYNASHFQLSIHPSSTLSTLRGAIATKLGCLDPEEIRMYYLGREFSTAMDHNTLEELNVESGQTFLASRRPLGNKVYRQQAIQKHHPTDLLLEPEFFERIRHALLLDEEYALQAWDIVTRLPTSPMLLQSFQDLKEDVNWNSLLDARSPFLLLYSLQILNALIKQDQLHEELQDQKWIKKFVDLGGQDYLISLLMSESGLGSSDTRATARKALGLSLKVLVRLTDSFAIGSSESLSPSGLTVPVFINKLVAEILTSAARAGADSPNDQSIVLNATSLISHFCSGPLGWQNFQSCPDVRSLIFVSMVKSDSVQIRQTVLEMGRRFCKQSITSENEKPVMFFLDVLQSFLPIPKEYEGNCTELFEFFEAVAREAIQYCTEEFYKNLYIKLMETIMNHPTVENSSLLKEDTVLVGMLKVATAMMSTLPQLKYLDTDFRIIDYVFDECLFPSVPDPTDSDLFSKPVEAKCQSEASRAAAFEFLEESTRSTRETLCHVVKKTHQHFQREHDMDELWGYDPQTIKRAPCGFVGLQNLGATCYVNSLIQQFFMNKAFRRGIMDAPIGEDEPDKHDTLLYQLQLLFGTLQGSMKRSYNAHGFCYAYKDWDGNPMNVAVQMDVDEFFSILFDRLENSVKGTPQEELFKEQYGGKLVQQIKSKDCEHISEREDSFFSIQCEVKNKKTLEESLQLYVQGEILDGDNKYKCSSCDKHVDAIKRACIKELPQNLILHLKRFDYDMDTMRRIKINDRFEFPTRLDMEPYTLDYLTRKEQAQEGGGYSPLSQIPEHSSAFQYNLVGVLVHTGTADSGHYYSYIKDRSAPESDSDVGSEHTQWYHFNDSKVEEFDPIEIPSKAFGGAEFIPSESPYLKSPSRTMTKPYSAYMLFYERADANHPSNPAAEEDRVPADIKDVILKENTVLRKDLVVFDTLYYQFVWDLFHMFDSMPPLDHQLQTEMEADEKSDFVSLQYGLDFFFSVLIHARNVDQELQNWTQFLSVLLARYPNGCLNFLHGLTQKETMLSSVLLYCPISQVRDAVVALIFTALQKLRDQDKSLYGLVPVEETSSLSSSSPSGDHAWVCGSGSPTDELIMFLLKILPEARTNWRNFDEFFKLMYHITQLGRAERIAMIRGGYITELVEFYISDEKFDHKRKMGDKFTKPAFQYLLLTVQELICSCDVVRSYQQIENQGPGYGHGSRSVRRDSASDTSSSTSSAVSSPSSEGCPPIDESSMPAVGPDVALLSRADLGAIFASQGTQGTHESTLLIIKKMLADRIESAVISKIVCHLAVHELLGQKLLESLANNQDYGHEERCAVILQVFKSVVQIGDDLLLQRVEYILLQITKFLEVSPHGTTAYDCLEFFRTISDYGQCGRFAQAWLLRNSRVWLQELLLMQADSETRARARLFYMELLSSQRAFNGWTDEQAALASSEHFSKLLELMNVLPQMLAYPSQARGDEEEGGWRLVEYFKTLTDLVQSDAERDAFIPHWKMFIDILTRIDAQQLNLDYDKKEMIVFWGRIMNDNVDRNTQLARYPAIGNVLRKFFVCLQNSPVSVQFHNEVLPLYFGLVLRFSTLCQHFHREWVQCHNFSWALGAMKWGTFVNHCPKELDQLLEYTLKAFPLFRDECWRTLPSPETPRFHSCFIMMARAMFETECERAGMLFFQNNGLVVLTDALVQADQGTMTNESEFYAIDALTLLRDYLCRMQISHNSPYFAMAIDHWSNIEHCIRLLTGNLSFNTPRQVYLASILVLQEIVKEARFSQAVHILTTLDTAHCQWRDLSERGIQPSDVQNIFGGNWSPFCKLGAVEAPTVPSGVGVVPVRVGPLIVVHPDIISRVVSSPQAIVADWYIPYWNLALLVCKMDGPVDHSHKAVELAALLAMEQITVGSLIHFEVLCAAAEKAEKNDDAALSLQNPYVTMFVERFLKRQNFIDLKKDHLEAGQRFFNVVSQYMDSTVVDFLSAAHLDRLEAIIDNHQGKTNGDDQDTVMMLSEPDLVYIVNCLQNFKLLGLASKGKILDFLYARLGPILASTPAPFDAIFPGLLQLSSDEDKEVGDESGDSTLNEGSLSTTGGGGSIKNLSRNNSVENIVVQSPADPCDDEDVSMVAAVNGEDSVIGKEQEKLHFANDLKDGGNGGGSGEQAKVAGAKADVVDVITEV